MKIYGHPWGAHNFVRAVFRNPVRKAGRAPHLCWRCEQQEPHVTNLVLSRAPRAVQPVLGATVSLGEQVGGAVSAKVTSIRTPFWMVCSATSTPMAFSSAMAFVEIVMAEIEVPVAMVDESVTLVLAAVTEIEVPVVCVVNRPTAVVLMSA